MPAPVFTSTAGSFPPPGQTNMTTVIPSYLYQEYSDDSDLQAFINAYNSYTQNYVDTFNGLNLPIYTASNISGSLLDWVGAGLYGLVRPALSSGLVKAIGFLNTYEMNTLELNRLIKIYGNAVVTDDDTYKRIITWHFYKGDGKVFDVRWLKRRIMRFLIGTNGTAPNIDQTYQISVTFGPNNEAAIRFIDFTVKVLRGAILNTFELNTTEPNSLYTQVTQLTPLPYRVIFQEAVDSGALELPFEYTWTVTI